MDASSRSEITRPPRRSYLGAHKMGTTTNTTSQRILQCQYSHMIGHNPTHAKKTGNIRQPAKDTTSTYSSQKTKKNAKEKQYDTTKQYAIPVQYKKTV